MQNDDPVTHDVVVDLDLKREAHEGHVVPRSCFANARRSR